MFVPVQRIAGPEPPTRSQATRATLISGCPLGDSRRHRPRGHPCRPLAAAVPGHARRPLVASANRTKGDLHFRAPVSQGQALNQASRKANIHLLRQGVPDATGAQMSPKKTAVETFRLRRVRRSPLRRSSQAMAVKTRTKKGWPLAAAHHRDPVRRSSVGGPSLLHEPSWQHGL